SRRALPIALILAAAIAAIGASSASAFVFFDSPSQNIGCAMAKGGVRCDISQHSWQAPPKPRSCELDYGGGDVVDRHHRAEYVCAGDTVVQSGPVLPYGHSKTKGPFRCTSEEAGVRCVNRHSGHGFFLARQRVRLF